MKSPHRASLLQACALGLTAFTWTPVASAHPSFETKSATIGSSYKAVIRIPHGCDGSPTTRVRVQIPEGVIGVKPMPKPGWSLETKRGPYERSYPYYHGATLSEGVREISWAGKLLDEHYDEFAFAGFLADSLEPSSTLYFPVYQDCETGSQAWIELPAAGQSAHDLKWPAPGVALLPAADKGKASTQTYKLGPLVIESPWARATPGGAKIGGGYVKITNTGSEPDRLVGGTLANAGEVEVHEMSMQNDVMKMRRLPDGLEVKPGETVELKPGGNHLMFMELKSGLSAGQRVKGTLVFQKAGTVEVEYGVAPLGAQSPDGASGGVKPKDGHHHH